MGEFPTRLVITSTNVSATFAKVGYLGLKTHIGKEWDKLYNIHNFQASQVEEEWEILNWKINEVTIASIDAVSMYPSIKFPLVKKAILYFTINLPKSQQSNVNCAWNPLRLGWALLYLPLKINTMNMVINVLKQKA